MHREGARTAPNRHGSTRPHLRILIVGAGDVGFHLAQQLSGEGHDVVVVERNRERARTLEETTDVLVVEGDGASLSILEQAGVKGMDLLLAVTSEDEVNLMVCLSGLHYGVPKRIARVSKPDYYDRTGILPPEHLGVDLMINPERECALETYQLLQSGAATEFAQFEGGLVQVIGVPVKPDAPVVGRQLRELAKIKRVRTLVVAIARDGGTIVPTGDTRIEEGDLVYVLGGPSHLPGALRLAGYSRFNLRRVIIAGGSREAWFLARTLEAHRIGATILETDRARALALAEDLQRSLVLHGDATDLELLEMEGVGEADGFVAYTGSDETNLLSCLLAKSLGTRKVIALIDRFDYVPLVARVGVDAAVSPRLAAVNAILSYVRRGLVLAVATLKGTTAQGIEFDVSERFPHAGHPLENLALPKGTIVGAIIRRNRVIIPRGRDQIRVGDRVIVFTVPEAIRSLEALFA